MAREPVNNTQVLVTYGKRVGLGLEKEYRILYITADTGSLATDIYEKFSFLH